MQRNINPRTNKTASTITKIIHHVNSHRNPLQYSIPLQSWSKTQTSSGSINRICLFARCCAEGDAIKNVTCKLWFWRFICKDYIKSIKIMSLIELWTIPSDAVKRDATTARNPTTTGDNKRFWRFEIICKMYDAKTWKSN